MLTQLPPWYFQIKRSDVIIVSPPQNARRVHNHDALPPFFFFQIRCFNHLSSKYSCNLGSGCFMRRNVEVYLVYSLLQIGDNANSKMELRV